MKAILDVVPALGVVIALVYYSLTSRARALRDELTRELMDDLAERGVIIKHSVTTERPD